MVILMRQWRFITIQQMQKRKADQALESFLKGKQSTRIWKLVNESNIVEVSKKDLEAVNKFSFRNKHLKFDPEQAKEFMKKNEIGKKTRQHDNVFTQGYNVSYRLRHPRTEPLENNSEQLQRDSTQPRLSKQKSG